MMRVWRSALWVVAFLGMVSEVGAVGVSLGGSPASVIRQNSIAKELGYEFVDTSEEVAELVASDALIPVPGNEHYDVAEFVSYKVARPEMRLFIERLAEQYHEGTGEKLVVTSLTRPSSEQPRNAHPLSVHPTGMAVDLRVSQNAKSRAWLEGVLLKLERQGVLDITRERRPPHYHVALFPQAYRDYLGSMIGEEAVVAALEFKEPEPAPEQEAKAPARQAATGVTSTVAAAQTGNASSETLLTVLAVLPWLVVPVALFWRRRRGQCERCGDLS